MVLSSAKGSLKKKAILELLGGSWRFNGGGDDDIRMFCFASGLLAGNRGPGVHIVNKVRVNPHCSTPSDRCGNKSLLLLTMSI